jgi:UDP-N-acetyl-D-galactosamine dehydrogenase
MGLGYVGPPLAHAFPKHYKVVGYDINEQHVTEINNREDRGTSLYLRKN